MNTRRRDNGVKRQRRIPILDQWVEVTIQDGYTITELFPPNEVLKEEGRAMDPPPELVYRRIFFPGGVPPEYAWTRPDDNVRTYGGGCIQRMTVETWLEAIEREEAQGLGHISDTGIPSIPRPNERGGCECEACQANQDMLDELGYAT